MTLSLLLFSQVLFSCPELTGTYTCYTESQTEPLQIQQSQTQHGYKILLDYENQPDLTFLADSQLRIEEQDLTQDERVIGQMHIETLTHCRGPIVDSYKTEKRNYYDLGLMVFEDRFLIELQKLGIQYTQTNIFTDIDGKRLKESKTYFCQKN